MKEEINLEFLADTNGMRLLYIYLKAAEKDYDGVAVKAFIIISGRDE
jgi:hypothetical protein